MAFQKAKAEQAYLKMLFYGPPGSGKTLTALLVAEGLAANSGKRVAVVDTERGTDFYAQPVKERRVHPAAFDFDAAYTRSVSAVLEEVRGLDVKRYGVVVIDSLTHVWEAAQAAFEGRKNKAGQLPFGLWPKVKKPYKDLLHLLLNLPLHVVWCARQKAEYGESEDGGEKKLVGFAPSAERDSTYEPHFAARFEAARPKGAKQAVHVCHVEKDRSGVLAGRTVEWPSFDTLALPLLGLLGDRQAQLADDEETAAADAEAFAHEERERAKASALRRDQFAARMRAARTYAELNAVAAEVKAAAKGMLPEDVQAVRDVYAEAREKVTPAGTNGKPPPPASAPAADNRPAGKGDAWEG